MATLQLIGGLGTVITALTMIAWFLAGSPAHREELVAHPDRIAEAIEEMMRRFGPGINVRCVAQDLEFKGVRMRQGDLVVLPMGLTGLDDRRHDDPLRVDFSRADKRHQSFGRGPHACIGAMLARNELRVFLTEWLARIPVFNMAPGFEPRMLMGQAHSLQSLELVWPLERAP